MTMWKRDPNNIWRNVREDQDIDDMIFGDDAGFVYERECVPSDR